MKHIFRFLILIAVIAGLYYFVSKNDTVLEVPIVFSEAELLVLNDEVKVDDVLVSNEASLASGNKIKTNVNGRAIIKTGPQLITSIGENTEVVFQSEADLGQSEYEVIVGRLWSRLERALEQDEIYQVYTPTLAAAVRGTSFGAVVTDEVDEIKVFEGKVLVSSRADKSEETVNAGEVVSIEDGKLMVRKMTEADRDDWFMEHTDPMWIYGGQPLVTLINATRDGFWWSNPGQVTVTGTGFNKVRKLEVDGELISFVPVSDTQVRIPVAELINLNETSEAYLFYDGGKILANDIFDGDRAEVRKNLLGY